LSEKEILELLKESVIEGYEEQAAEVAQMALQFDMDPLRALKEGLVVGMNTVGERMEVRHARD